MNLALVMPDLGFGIVTASVLAMGAVGFSMLYGITGVINFAYGDEMTVAAYATYVVNVLLNVNVWISAAVITLGMGFFSVAMARGLVAPFKRRRAGTFALMIITFALGIVFQNLLQVIFGSSFQSFDVSQPRTVHFLGMIYTNQQLVIIAIGIVAMLALHFMLQFTRVGVAMRAMSDNVPLARACGINTPRMTDLTWFLAGLLAGAGGFVLALNTTAFGPSLGETFLLVIVSAAILGGVGRPYGAMVGAVIVGVVTAMSVLVLPAADKTAVALIILVLVLLIRPHGISASAGRT
jgi:branched-subunit amino acid ABC-type transport system permease component